MELASQLWNPSGRFRLISPDGSYEVSVNLLEEARVELSIVKEADKVEDTEDE